jgi:hypothetical protein
MVPLIGVLVGAIVLLGATTPATAHPTTSFTACAAFTATSRHCYPGDSATSPAASYYYGDTVHLRGKIRPAHAGGTVQVWRARPARSTWRQVGTARVNANGGIRWNWATTRADANQAYPYRFQFRAPGHGRSNRVRLYVLFGE